MPNILSPLRIGSGVCPGGALDRAHPLNVGKVAHWRALPGRMGGPTWYDLAQSSNGTLAGGVTWGPTTRPGGAGELRFDGSTGHVDCGTGGKVTSGRITVACWAKPGVTSRGDLVTRWKTALTAGDQFDLLYGLTAGKPEFYVSSGSTFGTSGAGPTAMTAGTWYHVVGTYDGGTSSVYLNGVLQSSAPLAVTLGTPDDTAGYRLGDNLTGDGALTGSLDDVAIFSRTLSPAEVAALYLLSRQGDPGVLNRAGLGVSPIGAGGGPAAPVFRRSLGQRPGSRGVNA